MRLSVFVNDTDLTDSVRASSIEITQNITDRVSQATLEFISPGGDNVATYDDDAYYDEDYYAVDVRELYEIKIRNRDTDALVFSGTIRQIKPIRQKSDLMFLQCQCADWALLTDEAYIVEENFTETTDADIIMYLGAKYAKVLTTPSFLIRANANLQSWQIKEKTLRQALDELSEFTGAEWRVTFAKQLMYFKPVDYPAPFGLSSQPNSVATLVGLTWNSATGTWDTTNVTWEESGNPLYFGSGGELTWDEDLRQWVETDTHTWDDPGEPPLKTFGIDAFTDYDRDAVRIINHATVLGAVGPGGARIKAIYENPVSQATYGIQTATIVDDQITNAYNAALRAQTIVEDNAFPRETIGLRTIVDGLEAGQSLPIYHQEFLLNGAYVIREMRIRQLTSAISEYQITAGARAPDTIRLLKQLEARTRRFTESPTAVPADATVTDASIAGQISAAVISSVNSSSILGTIVAGQIASVNATAILGTISADNIGDITADQIIGQITADKIDSVNATAIQGSITADKITSITAGQITGVIVSNQLVDGIIDSLSKIAAPLRDIPESFTNPSLPDPNFPEGSFYRNIPTNTFRKVSGGTWVNVTEAEAITGKMAFYSLGSVKAGSIVGLITSIQIGSVQGSTIIGTITSDHIGGVSGDLIQGTIIADRIGGIYADRIIGTISGGTIGSINVNSLTGTLTAAMAARIDVGTLQGQITSSQIASLTITGGNIANLTITATQIGNLAITDAKIASLNASKLTAGTIDANVINVVNLNAANITTGSISANRIGAGTITASVSITAPVISGGSIQMNGPYGTFWADTTAITVGATGNRNDRVFIDQYTVEGDSAGQTRFALTRSTGGGSLHLFTSGNQLAFKVDAGATLTATNATNGPYFLPSGPAGFLIVTILGSVKRIPYYNP